MDNLKNDSVVFQGSSSRKLELQGSLKATKQAQASRPVLVLDRSGSMSDPVKGWEHTQGEERHRKIDELRRIVTRLRGEASFDQLVFDDEHDWTEELPDPRGGTDLAGALRKVAEDRPTTRRVVVVTDGYPNSREDALLAAKELGKPIDVFYVGPESEQDCIDFLRRLAEAGGGNFGSVDLAAGSNQLENKLKLALNPAPSAIEMANGQ